MDPDVVRQVALEHIAEVTAQQHNLIVEFRCNVCLKPKHSGNALRDHLKSQTDYPYRCEEETCHAAFKDKDGLRIHKGTVKAENKSRVKCKVGCKRLELGSLNALIEHYQFVHEVQMPNA